MSQTESILHTVIKIIAQERVIEGVGEDDIFIEEGSDSIKPVGETAEQPDGYWVRLEVWVPAAEARERAACNGYDPSTMQP